MLDEGVLGLRLGWCGMLVAFSTLRSACEENNSRIEAQEVLQSMGFVCQ